MMMLVVPLSSSESIESFGINTFDVGAKSEEFETEEVKSFDDPIDEDTIVEVENDSDPSLFVAPDDSSSVSDVVTLLLSVVLVVVVPVVVVLILVVVVDDVVDVETSDREVGIGVGLDVVVVVVVVGAFPSLTSEIVQPMIQYRLKCCPIV